MRIYRDGKFFAQGDSLDEIAEVSGEDVSRYSFDLDELKLQKTIEARRHVVAECEALMPVYEALYLIRGKVDDPRLSEMDALAKKGRDMEKYINDSKRTEAELEAISWD